MFGLLVEVDAHIQTMADRQTIIVAIGDVAGFLDRAVGLYDDGFPFGNSDTPAGVEYPRSPYINAIVEFMVEAKADIMTAVDL